MKTIEDKAKAYDEAIERAKKWYNAPNVDKIPTYANRIIEELFPALAESEDERIRNQIIEHIKWSEDVGNCSKEEAEQWIAWIEKQGKETSWKPSKEEMDVLYGLAYITNQYDEHKEEVITRLYQDLKREFFNGSSYENMFPNTEDGVRCRSTIQVLEYARSLNTYNQYGKADIDKNIAWLEKQGEQKPAWSEEDEYYRNIIMYCLNGESVGNVDKENAVLWLKSLKEKIGEFDDGYKVGFSAAKHNQWKPSEEQMEAMQKALVDLCGKDEHNIITGLYYDLKKLMEE